MTTPKLGIGEHVESQTNGEVVANSAYRKIEALSILEVLDRDLNTPPAAVDGDTYIVGPSPTGAWAGKAGQIAYYSSGWIFVVPKGAMQAFIKDEKQWWGYSSVESEWHPMQEIWSTSEHWTGKYNGSSKVYSKSFLGIVGPGISATQNTPHGITGLDNTKRVGLEDICWYHPSGGYGAFPAPSAGMNHVVDTTNIVFTDISGSIDWSVFRADIRIEYCKT